MRARRRQRGRRITPAVSSGNVTARIVTWRTFLLQEDLRRGYADYWNRVAWPEHPSWSYEDGRAIAAELDGLGLKPPAEIPSNRKQLGPKWHSLFKQCEARKNIVQSRELRMQEGRL